MNSRTIEIEPGLRQYELPRVVGRARQARAPRLSARDRRQVVGLIGSALVTFALLLGGAATADPGAGAGDGTPANIVVEI